jgi:hypothetical protein
MYIMTPEQIFNGLGLLHKFLSLVCVSPRVVPRQRLGRHVPVATNTRNNREIFGGVIFYTVLVVSKEILRVCMQPCR